MIQCEIKEREREREREREKIARIKDYRKNAKTNVILDVGSVRNALHELRSSSLDLQGHNLKLNGANKT